MTLQDVSDLSGISIAQLSRIERDERRLSPAGKVRLARALGVRIADLFPAGQAKT